MNSVSESFSNRTIAVYGAGGHTGRFVVEELLRRGLVPILAGRNSERLRDLANRKPELEVRFASIEDPAALDRAFEGAAAVINCAGPYLDTASPVIAAALRAKIHYVDVAPEQAAAQSIFDQFDVPARRAGVAIIPAFGFYGGLADLLATAAMDEWKSADEIRIGIALSSWKPTTGTRLTGARNNGPRFILSKGRLTPVSEPRARETWRFPPPFGDLEVVELPLSEIVTISRHLPVPEIRAFMNDAPLADLHDPATPAPVAADESGRSDQLFTMDVLVRKREEQRRATVRGRDIYAASAPMVVEATERILNPRFDAFGATPGGALFDARDFLRAMSDEHFSVDLGNVPATMR